MQSVIHSTKSTYLKFKISVNCNLASENISYEWISLFFGAQSESGSLLVALQSHDPVDAALHRMFQIEM